MPDNNRRKPDHFSKKARQKGYAARSVFKLREIDQREHLLGPRVRVLDLGCSPGSWMQYSAKLVGPDGLVVGIDYRELTRDLSENERYFQADVFEFETDDLLGKFGPFDLVISDMMADTIGHKMADSLRSSALAFRALDIAESVLAPGGSLLVKVFQGPDFNEYREALKQRFKTLKVRKPKSSRAKSREIYLVARDFSGSIQGVKS